MKLFVEKLSLGSDNSFVVRTHTTPLFEVPWHQHTEYELIYITQGSGLSFVGNYVGDFEAGDIFFLGSNLPHTFQKSRDLITSAVVVHFRDDFWGKEFLQMPEAKSIRELLTESECGFKLSGETKKVLATLIKKLENTANFKRIIILCECLDLLSGSKERTALSTQAIMPLNNKYKERIDRIFQFTMNNFREVIHLSTVAGIANMSIPAFCNYFKKTTRKKYIDFVNEVRIGYSSQLLLESEKNIIEVCYESGFNTVANFNKQFLRLKGMTPSKFRNAFSGSSADQEPLLINREMQEQESIKRN